jgi:hypothetical protein
MFPAIAVPQKMCGAGNDQKSSQQHRNRHTIGVPAENSAVGSVFG